MISEFEKYSLYNTRLIHCTLKMYRGITSVGKGIKCIVDVKSNFKSRVVHSSSKSPTSISKSPVLDYRVVGRGK